MPLLNVSLGIGFAGAKQVDTLEIPDVEWENCVSDNERMRLMEEYAEDWANNFIDISYEVKE